MKLSTRATTALAVVVLVGALFLGAPTPTFATNTVTGVPASVSWSTAATPGGSELRVRVDVVGTPIRLLGTTTYYPGFGMITDLCRVAVPTVPCTGANMIPIASMKFAASTSSSFAACTVGINPNLAGPTPMLVADPSALGVGHVAVAQDYALCSTNTGAGAGVGCASCTAGSNQTVTISGFYVAVTVPAGKNAGTYTTTLRFVVGSSQT